MFLAKQHALDARNQLYDRLGICCRSVRPVYFGRYIRRAAARDCLAIYFRLRYPSTLAGDDLENSNGRDESLQEGVDGSGQDSILAHLQEILAKYDRSIAHLVHRTFFRTPP